MGSIRDVETHTTADFLHFTVTSNGQFTQITKISLSLYLPCRYGSSGSFVRGFETESVSETAEANGI